jgi:hypothetical protein
MRLLPTGPTTRIVIRWLFVILGILAALVAPVTYRDAWVGQDPAAPVELTIILQTTGVACLALILVLSSFTALRSARVAGIMLLVATPVLAFALAYPEAGFMAAGADGQLVFRLPPLGRGVAIAVSFYLPFVVLFAARKRRYAALFLLASVLPITFLLAVVRGATVLVPGLARNSALLLVFGLFWLGTHWFGWPALRTVSRAWSGRLCLAAAVCLLIALLLIGGTIAGCAVRSSLWTPDCSGSRPFARPLSSSHVVITAHILRTAHTNNIAGRWAGSWAIAIVKERFWGLPSWVRVVLLTNGIYWENKTYLVSGARAYGALARLLPIVDATRCGSYFAAPVGDAGPELRLLREAPADGERRIVGNVLAANRSHWKQRPPGNVAAQRPFHSWRNHENKELYDWALNAPKSHHSLPGARIGLTGPSGTTIFATDQDGIFELANLPPANYTLHLLDVPAYQQLQDLTLTKEALAMPGLSRMDLIANWMGMIEGTLTDTLGRPVAGLVELRNPDGTNADRSIGEYRLAADGRFRFENLPAGGRYLVLMNRFGPSIQSPYPSMYYPSARRPEDAQVFEVKGAEVNTHVDFHVVRLQERKLSVRATWADGRPLVDGSITVVNAQPEAYDDLAGLANEFPTNNDGVAEVRVFGDIRVRLRAATYNPEETEPPFTSVSRPMLLETWRLPPVVNFVVPFAPGHRSR